MRIKKQIERWFEIPNDPDEGQILIKHLSPGEVSDIMDETFKQTIVYKAEGFDPKTGKPTKDLKPEITQKSEIGRQEREKSLAAVANWKKFYDQEGKVLKCTPANVIRASREIEGFDALVRDFRDRLAEDIQDETVKEEKELKINL